MKSNGGDQSAIRDLIHFLEQNKTLIDAEAEGKIEITYSDGETAFAYVQSLTYTGHRGKLMKWPCTDGWNVCDKRNDTHEYGGRAHWDGSLSCTSSILAC